ncbi:hypothetical protein CTAYLR_002359 [Chrysophaeum taylorii]|uniref:Amino acid transporter transmembrane domain-containing protein n=1 Tax=Chrysophaeum taylorii TaxID=2483200 RepID=A0AAD7UGH1_9STRA|nr:hypothetical protein CTAYLR_002359 [Chrysophaeum taylorii]
MTVVGGEGANMTTGLVYFIKAFVGPGCLSLPLAFQNCGVVLGSSLLLLTSVLVTFNLRTMVLCKQHLAYKGIRTYADLTREALGETARRLVELFINGVQLGICAVYFDFFAENARALVPHLLPRKGALYILMAVIFPVYASLALLRSVDAIAPYAALANALVYVAIGIVMFAAVATIHHNYWGGGRVDDHLAMADPKKMPLFYSTVVYSFEGVCSLLPVENALARPLEDMPKVMYVGMLVVTLTYGSVGTISYLAWPGVTSGSITAEVSKRASGASFAAKLPSLVANVATIVAVVLTFPVQLFPSIELLEKTVGFSSAAGKSKRSTTETEYAPARDAEVGIEMMMTPVKVIDPEEESKDDDAITDPHKDEPREDDEADPSPLKETPPLKRAAFRVSIVVGVGLVAALVPDLGALIDLIGALTGSALSLVVPALIDIKCPRPGRQRWELYVDIFVLLVGLVGAVAGTIQAVQNALGTDDPTPSAPS